MKLTITARVITVDKIWSLTSVEDPGVRMKDTCLSFALYKLLRRRFAGYRLVEAGHPKTLAFVMRGLLSGDKEGERTFRVIEVELAFLYDSFYTTYPVIFSRWFKMLAKSCLLLLVSLWVITLPIYNLDEIEDEYHTIFDVNVTYALVSSMIGLELCQIIVFVLSDWAKVLAICKFVEKPSLHGNLFYQMIFRFLCRPRRILSRWNGKLGQYSLVDSYNYCPCKLLLCMQGLFLMDKTRKGQKAGPQIKLPREVKKAIVSSLGATGGKLSNGLSSLSRNEVSDSLSWACKFETLTHTHTILVWHIATSMCQNARERRQIPTEASEDKSNVIVASSLSRYCAYLVAFAPELLPDHKFVTSCIFDNVIKEARRDLAGCKNRAEKYDKLTQEGVPEETVMGRGEKLGKQLLQLQEELRWRVLADFWSEMMLYLAPSDNAKAHAEHLAKGGEFITHLWALLSHAGVLQRDDASPA